MNDQRDKHEEQDQGGSGLGWFLTGAAIGAAVAILYAPRRGNETRQYIAEKAQQGKEAVQQGKEAVESAGDNIIEASREMFERGRKLVEDASDLFERGRNLVRG